MSSYETLASSTTNPLTKQLLSIILSKKSNLAVSIDVTSPESLVSIIRAVGPSVCIVKTHIDILTSFPETLIQDLQSLSQEHNFLIFEDRKFADIGNTVALQYAQGIYKIVSWADIVTVHAVPGPGILSGLKSVVGDCVRGALMLAEMSSKGNLCSPEYQRGAIDMAREHRDYVLGFIAMRPVEEGFLTLTPGVQIASTGDALGQVYREPRQVVREGSDVIIVGRGITGATDVAAQAELYRKEGWEGYLERIASRIS